MSDHDEEHGWAPARPTMTPDLTGADRPWQEITDSPTPDLTAARKRLTLLTQRDFAGQVYGHHDSLAADIRLVLEGLDAAEKRNGKAARQGGWCRECGGSTPQGPTLAFTTMAGEMAAQASRGHTRYCLGVHEHDTGEYEYKWIDWTEAFANLARADRIERSIEGGGPKP